MRETFDGPEPKKSTSRQKRVHRNVASNSTQLKVTGPGPWKTFLEDVPSVNHIHGRSWLKIDCPFCKRFIKKVPGFTYTTTEGKNFLEYAALLLKTACPLRDYEGKLVVEAFAHWPDRKARDMNNYAKFIADALQLGGVVKNDKTVLWREMDYILDPGVQGFELKIYPMEDRSDSPAPR